MDEPKKTKREERLAELTRIFAASWHLANAGADITPLAAWCLDQAVMYVRKHKAIAGAPKRRLADVAIFAVEALDDNQRQSDNPRQTAEAMARYIATTFRNALSDPGQVPARKRAVTALLADAEASEAFADDQLRRHRREKRRLGLLSPESERAHALDLAQRVATATTSLRSRPTFTPGKWSPPTMRGSEQPSAAPWERRRAGEVVQPPPRQQWSIEQALDAALTIVEEAG